MDDLGDHCVTTGFGALPDLQPVDHARTHLGRQLEPRGRSTAGECSCHVLGVRRSHRRERRVVGQTCCEACEEPRQLLVGHVGQLPECVDRCSDGRAHDGVFGVWHVQQVARVVHDHQAIALAERGGQLGVDLGDPIAPERDELSGGQNSQRCARHGDVA